MWHSWQIFFSDPSAGAGASRHCSSTSAWQVPHRSDLVKSASTTIGCTSRGDVRACGPRMVSGAAFASGTRWQLTQVTPSSRWSARSAISPLLPSGAGRVAAEAGLGLVVGRQRLEVLRGPRVRVRRLLPLRHDVAVTALAVLRDGQLRRARAEEPVVRERHRHAAREQEPEQRRGRETNAPLRLHGLHRARGAGPRARVRSRTSQTRSVPSRLPRDEPAVGRPAQRAHLARVAREHGLTLSGVGVEDAHIGVEGRGRHASARPARSRCRGS